MCPMIGQGVGGGVQSVRSDSGVVQGQRRRGGAGAMWRRLWVGLARWGGAVRCGAVWWFSFLFFYPPMKRFLAILSFFFLTDRP